MEFKTEAEFEQALVDKLTRDNGWNDVLNYPDEATLIANWQTILFENNRERDRLNECPLTASEMGQILEKIRALETPLKLNSFINGREVLITRDNPDDTLHLGRQVGLRIYDRQEIASGSCRYQIARQPRFAARKEVYPERRGDVMLLINGMPVIHIELKRSGVPISEAASQIEKYSKEGIFQGIFSLVQIFFAMNPNEAVYFANPGKIGEDEHYNKAFFFHWADRENNPVNHWSKIANQLLSIPMAHTMIGFYTIADHSDGILKVMRSYQYYAASEIAVKAMRKDWDDDSRASQLGGYVWHTTGSGKTLTSFKSAQLIASFHAADKVIFLVDRKELGTQSLKEYRSFSTEVEDVQATENTRILLARLMSKDPANTLIVTSIQKMSRLLSGREELPDKTLRQLQSKKLVIIVDECHRSTFGESMSIIKEQLRRSIIFGFTGTPIQDVNAKKDSTTTTIFGDELHRYTLANGIRDKNVLGFDPYRVEIYPANKLRQQVALNMAKAPDLAAVNADPDKQQIFYKYMDSSQVSMAGFKQDLKYIKGIEDYIPDSQYQTESYRRALVNNIKEGWEMYSRGKFHAIFATSSIPEAVAYYRLFRELMPDLKVTALFDPTIDNNDESLEKEDGIVEILTDYNKIYDHHFSLTKYDAFRKDVSERLAHKGAYTNLPAKEQLNILIVVNMMLTGFDSKWLNTLYLDKVLEYEHLIQAFSRTNRLYNESEKPFGIIRYYRRPYTMQQNIAAAVNAYSGNIPLGLFVEKLPHNLRELNRTYEAIGEVFFTEDIKDFQHLPERITARRDFAKLFNEFNRYLEAARIQGFSWQKSDYTFAEEKSTITIKVNFDESNYSVLLARYKELARENSVSVDGEEIAYDIEPHITEYDTAKIDADYMNQCFVNFIQKIHSQSEVEVQEKAMNELQRSYAMLSVEEQNYANIFINDVRNGQIKLVEGKSFREYIAEMMEKALARRIGRLVKNLGCDEELLTKLIKQKPTKENIDAHGRFTELKNTVNRHKAQEYFKARDLDSFVPSKLGMNIDRELRKFVLSGGATSYDDEDSDNQLNFTETVNETTTAMLSAIKNLNFGEAFTKLLSKEFCPLSIKELKQATGLGNAALGRLKANRDLDKTEILTVTKAMQLPEKVVTQLLDLAGMTV